MVQSATPANTTMNFFDYWTTDNQNDYVSLGKSALTGSKGINADHALKFNTGGNDTKDTGINQYSGSVQVTNFVESTLENNFPVIKKGTYTNRGTSGAVERESLDYLFNSYDYQSETNAVAGKKAYTNVSGLFQLDSKGYYTYDSSKNFALFNPDSTGNSGSFTVYNKSAVGTGNFFPLTANQSLTDVFDVSGDTITAKSKVTADSNNTVNHHMGVSMDTTFTQPVDGKVASGDAMTYEFSGDDDVWIYIDGVLVGDLGGIHGKASLSIDFSTGVVTVNGSNATYKTTTTLKDAYKAAGKESITSWSGNTYASNTLHDLKFFYLERGASASNMSLKFNLQTSPVSEVDKVDQNGNDVKGAQFALYSTDANYSTTGRTLLATGTTDEDGILQLKDAEGTAISFDIQYAEYKRQYFALVETSIPEGYRTSLSSNDHEMRLKYEPTESALGFSAGGVLVTASDSSGTNRMWLNGGYAAAMETLIAPSTVHTYEHPETTYDTGDGVTFAVICKRINNGDIAAETSWAPVTGDAYNGYTVAAELSVATAVAAAKESGAIYTKSSAGEYVAMLSNMPGDIKTYAAMMQDPDNSQFTVITGHTTASSLDEATDENTFIVDSSKFTREFATSLKVTNIQNRLWVTKVNSAGEAQNGAKFSLYKAADVENDIVTNEDGTLSLKEGSTAVAYDTATTADITDPYTMSGAACFPVDSDGHKALTNGVYYLVETAAPSGYELNSNVTKVYVTDGGVYADAGIEGDGVKTMSGPGSLLASLAQFGSNGTVDNTLYKITGTIQKASANDSALTWAAPATGAQSMNMHYTDKDGSSSVVLQYVNDDGNKLAALYEDTGISRMQITQNTTFAASSDFHGTNLGSQAINSLFTQSTGVQYTDKLLSGNLNIEMKNSGGNADDTFDVTVKLTDSDGTAISGTFGDNTFDKNGELKYEGMKGGDTKALTNLPAGATYTVTQTGKAGYSTTYTVNGGDPSSAPATGNIDPDNAQNVVVSNEYQAKTATVERDGATVSVNGQLVGAGEEITYTIGWVNNASVKADVAITDVLPNGLEFVSADGGAYDESTNTVAWSLKGQEAGATGTVTVKAKVSEAFSGNSITNGATIQLSDASGVISTYKPTSSTVDVPIKLVTGAADDGTVKIGDELTYTVSFTTNEAVDSADVKDTVPAGTEYVEGSVDSENPQADIASYESGTGVVEWRYENLPAGTHNVSFKVKVTAAAASLADGIENQATVKIGANGSELKTNKVNNKLSTGKLDVELVNNGGNSDDTFDVTVKLTDSDGTAISGTFGDNTFDKNGELKYEGMKGGETKTLKDLPAGAVYTVTQTDKDGYSTTYTVNGGDSSPTPATGKIDSTAKQTVVITDKLSKTATVQRDGQQVDAGGQLVGVGDVITYNINWLNDAKGDDGKLASAAVVVTDVIPAGTELVENSISEKGSYNDGTITWSLGDQAAGASGTVSFSVKVVDASNDADDDADGIIANTANIAVGNQPKVTNTSKVNVPTKFATRYPVTPEGTGTATTAKTATVGDTLAYNVSFVVPADATSATVTDVVPAGTEYVAESATCNNEGIACEPSCENGTVTWKLSNLTPGKTVTVTFQVKILASVDIDTGVNNAAKVTPNNGPEVSTNKVHTSIAEPVIVKGSTDLKFAKILAGRDWTSDDKFTFTIKAVTEGAPMPGNSTVEVTSKTAKSNDKVEFNFGDIKFATPGTYVYTVTETGNTATDVLSDQVPAKVTIVVTEDEGKLSAKTSIENGTFDNVAVVKTATFANTTANTDEPNVTADADDEEATEVKVGDVLQYTIPYSNTTGAQATIVVTDTLAEGLTLDKTTLDSSAFYDEGTRTITWTIKADKTESGTVGFRATVNSAAVKTIATDGTASLANTAKVSVKDNPKVTATSKPFTSTVKTGEVDVSVVNKGGDSAKEFTVTVTVTDKGGNPVTGTFGGTTFDKDGKATFTMVGGDTQKLTGLPEGATVTVTQTGEDGYTTTYTVNDTPADPATGTVDPATPQKVVITNTMGKTATVQRDGQQVDAGGQLIGVGDVITYNINWVNTAKDSDGKLASAAVTVTDALPAGTELVEGSLGTGSYDSETGVITWSLGDQAAGASGTVSFQAKVTDAAVTGSVENAASIKVGDNDPVSTNTVKSQMPKKTVARQAAGSETVGEAVATGSQAAVGDTLVYNVSFTVPSDCDSLTVSDVVPAGTAYVADSADNDGAFDQAKGTVTWKFGKLTAGTTVNVSFKAKVLASALTEAGNTVENTAQVQIGANGPKVSSNKVPTEIAKSVTVKGCTDLKLTKSLAGRDWASTDKFTFTIAADIEGAPMPANATAVVMSSTAKANDAVEFDFGDIQFTAPGTYKYTVTEIGNTASDVLSDLVPAKVTVVVTDGGKGVLEAKVTVDNGDFTNEAVVKSATFANAAADADADADDEATEVKVGDVLRYAITWANTTGEAATVVVTDKLPEGLTLDETKLEDAVYDAATRTITWTINADKTESGQVAFYATVNSAAVQSAAGSSTISNSAAVTVSAKDNPNVTTAATSKPFDSKVSTGDVEVSLKNDGGDPAQKFDVTVTVTDKGGNPVTGTFGEGDNAITLDKDGKATIAMVGGDTQKLTGLPEGATVTVTQTGEDGYTTTYKVNAGDPTTDPAKATVDSATPQKVVITNTAIKKVDYSANGGVVVSKTVNGHAMTAGQFAYTVKPDAAAAKKLGLDSSANAYKVTAADDGKASVIDLFGGKNVVFGPEDAGTYTFTIDETTAPDGSGYTNDSAQRTVTITVSVDPTTREVTVVTTATKAGEGKPFATSTVTSADKAGTVNKVVVPFVSTYEATGTLGGDGDGAVAIQASKTLTGRDMAAGEFNFVVTDAKGTKVATGTNAAATSGTAAAVTFSKIDYSVASLKEAVAAGTATMTADGAYKLQYNVAESTELPAGVTAGAKSFAITVTVTDNGDGTLTPKVTYPEGTESLAFTNSYSSESAPVTFAGTKVLSLADESLTRELKAGEFSFAVTATDGGKLPESTTATNDAAGNVKFGTVTYTQDDLAGVTADKDGIRTKTFTYQVSESGSVDGVTNDASAHKFTVTLTEDTAKATLTATVKAEEGTAATAGAFSFTNVYGVSDSSSSITDDTVEGQQPIKVNKTLTGRAMTAGEFKFELVDKDGTTVATGTNQADGTVTFGAVKYSKPGTYTYELREAEGELGGVTYDSTTYTVVTTVIDLGTGKLKVEHALYSAAGKEIADGVAKFANSYEPAATVAKINASKVLTGATLAKDQFTFAVTDADGNVVGTVTNDENGKISFSGLVVTADDMVDESGARVMTKTFTYYLSEVNDEQANVTYDGTVYTITVTVTDDGEGNLTAVVAYENVDDAPVFNNTYTEPAKAQAAASNNKTSSAKTGDGALQTILMLIGVAMAAAAATAAVSVRRKRNGMSE